MHLLWTVLFSWNFMLLSPIPSLFICSAHYSFLITFSLVLAASTPVVRWIFLVSSVTVFPIFVCLFFLLSVICFSFGLCLFSLAYIGIYVARSIICKLCPRFANLLLFALAASLLVIYFLNGIITYTKYDSNCKWKAYK